MHIALFYIVACKPGTTQSSHIFTFFQNHMDKVTIIGIIGSICTAAAMLPQLLKIFKEKKVEVSMGMLTVVLSGTAIWIYYGVLKEDWIIIISNGFSGLFNIITVLLYFKYKHKTK